jgi:branched-chain amino acid aminotransferase
MPTQLEPAYGGLPPEWATNGCFETMRAYRGRIFRLEAHMRRLEGSAAFLGTRLPPAGGLSRQLEHALKRSGIKEAVVRVAMIPQPQGRAKPHIVVQPARLPPPSAYRHGIRLAVIPARKSPVSSVNPQAKYSARLGSVLAVADAQLRGVDEALFMHELGSVTESTASNFGIVSRGTILTPPYWLGLLAGVTREVLFELAGALAIPMRESPLTRHDIYNADEAFLTSTLKEVLPVTAIDGRAIGGGRPGPVTRRLLEAFRRLVARELG